MTYQTDLPRVFPWRFTSNRTTIRFLIRQLVDPNRYLDNGGNGSSFAVTTDAPDGEWHLWLSDASKDYLLTHMAHIARNLINTREDFE